MVTSDITIHCLDDEMCEGIARALRKRPLRSRTPSLRVPEVCTDVSWSQYQDFLKALGDKHVRHFYDQGRLEIMSPLKSHELTKRLIGRLIETMAFSQRISIQSVGSTTFTSELQERGFEPDESYYIANEPKVRGKLHYEPDIDPLPDLVIEVEVSRKSKAKLKLLAAMKVPEVWVYSHPDLHFLVRTRRGAYKEAERSLAFPFLSPSDVTRFLEQKDEISENDLVRAFVKWAGKRRREHERGKHEA